MRSRRALSLSALLINMKLCYKIYLEKSDYERLLAKALEAGFTGRGRLSHFLSMLSHQIIIFGDANLKQILNMTSGPKV